MNNTIKLLNEGFLAKYEKPLQEEAQFPPLFKEVAKCLEKHGYDAHADGAANYVWAVVDYIELTRNNGDSSYSVEDWYKDRKMNYPEDFDVLPRKVHESLAESLKFIYRNLTEAEMSDEDRRDSELIRNIYNKIQKRANAALTPEEKEVMAKYNLDRTDSKSIVKRRTDNKYGPTDAVIAPHSMRDSDRNIFRRGRFGANPNAGVKPEVNLADKARKVSDRRPYTDSVVFQNTMYSPDTTHEHDKEYEPLSFQELERVKQNNNMYEPVRNMKDALRDRKYHEKEADKIDATYQKKLADIEKERQFSMRYHKNGMDSANNTIASLLKRK